MAVLLWATRATSAESCDHPPPLPAGITTPVWTAEMSQISKDLLFSVQSNLLDAGWDQLPGMHRSRTEYLSMA